MTAAILMAQGHSLSAAVHVVRMARPSSVLTGGQLACLVTSSGASGSARVGRPARLDRAGQPVGVPEQREGRFHLR